MEPSTRDGSAQPPSLMGIVSHSVASCLVSELSVLVSIVETDLSRLAGTIVFRRRCGGTYLSRVAGIVGLGLFCRRWGGTYFFGCLSCCESGDTKLIPFDFPGSGDSSTGTFSTTACDELGVATFETSMLGAGAPLAAKAGTMLGIEDSSNKGMVTPVGRGDF